jgi:hypothetical protein
MYERLLGCPRGVGPVSFGKFLYILVLHRVRGINKKEKKIF